MATVTGKVTAHFGDEPHKIVDMIRTSEKIFLCLILIYQKRIIKKLLSLF